MLSQTSKLLVDIKKKNVKKPLTFQHLLCILNNGEIQSKEAYRFLVEKHNVVAQPLNWLIMSFEEIQDISKECRQYIRINRPIWQQQQRKKKQQEQQAKIMQLETQRLRLEMIRKKITKQKMIEMCQQSIKKCEAILQVGVQDQQEYQRLKSSVKTLKRQLLILQGNYFDDIQHQTQQELAQKAAKQSQQNPQIFQILEQIRQRKRKQKEQKRLFIEQLKQQQQTLYLKEIKQLTKKLKLIYNNLSKQMYQPGQTFQNNSNYMKLFDMKIFIKYSKDFEIAKVLSSLKAEQKKVSLKIDPQFENNTKPESKSSVYHKHLIKLFKVYAKNGLWLDFIHFVFLNLQLVDLGSQYEKKQVTQIIFQDNVQQLQSYKDQLRKVSKLLHPKSQKNLAIDKKLHNVQTLNKIITKKKVFDIFNPMNLFTQEPKSTIKVSKLSQIASHTGIYKQDILKKLMQRKQQRKIEKQYILAQSKLESKRNSIDKLMPPKKLNIQERFTKINLENNSSSRLTTPYNKFTRDLSLPRLSRRSEKQKSIYDSLNKLKKSNILTNVDQFKLFQTKLFMPKQSKLPLKEDKNKEDDDLYLSEMFNKDKKIKSPNMSSSRKKQKQIIKPQMKFT